MLVTTTLSAMNPKHQEAAGSSDARVDAGLATAPKSLAHAGVVQR